jgi:Bacteroidetes VLRF1 release factor
METLLRKPLYIFDLPKALLESLVVKGEQPLHVEHVEPERPISEPQTDENLQNLATATATSCSLCRSSFANVQEQRQHVKSDFHKYNLKQRIKGLNPVSEADFEKLIEDLNESISGSDSDQGSEDEDRGAGNMLSTLLKKQAKLSGPDGTLDRTEKPSGNQPLVWLASPSLPENTSLGVYRVLFSTNEQTGIVESIQKKQLSPISVAGQGSSKSKLPNISTKTLAYFLCMIGGGHFAAMVVSLAPKLVAKHNASTERQAIVLAHKTFHRYTTRRKQGGSQSASDASKGAAHSAGSSLRRANEAALTAEVRALLGEWKSMIDNCELIFIRAIGTTNRRTLFGPYDGQVLSSKDPRNRGFPFTTRRATQSELMRAFVELTRVKVSNVDEASLRAAADTQKPSSEVTQPSKPKQNTNKPSPEEETQWLHTSQLTSLIKRSKIPALLSYIQNNNIDVNQFILAPNSQYHHTPTVLHFASSVGSVPVLSALLTKCKADPTLRNADGKTAAEVAHDRSTRDAFRSARYEIGDKAFAWDIAGVGPALSPAEAHALAARQREEAELEAQKEAERRKAATERLRKEDEEREQATAERKFGIGKTLNKEMTGAEKRATQQRDMTPAMVARLEREQRARAAEERMRRARPGGGA